MPFSHSKLENIFKRWHSWYNYKLAQLLWKGIWQYQSKQIYVWPMKRLSASLVIRKMQNKLYWGTTALACRIAKIQDSQYQVLVRMGATGTLLHSWWESKMLQLLWKTVWKFFYKVTPTLWPINSSLRYFTQQQ